MANWITHMRLADEVLKQLPDLDRLGFCMGSIAPDCNVENENWSRFDPPREMTHWMTPGSSFKQFDDCERFYDQRVRGKAFADNQERSFYLGYYAHLIADVTYLHFIRDEDRVKAMWRRIRAVPELDEKARDCDETFDSAKRLVDKPRRNAAVIALENEYLYAHPETAYLTVLQTVKEFPDYLDFLPKGAILRKIGVMGGVPEKLEGEFEQVFFTRKEMDGYIADTCAEIIRRITDKEKQTGGFLPG